MTDGQTSWSGASRARASPEAASPAPPDRFLTIPSKRCTAMNNNDKCRDNRDAVDISNWENEGGASDRYRYESSLRPAHRAGRVMDDLSCLHRGTGRYGKPTPGWAQQNRCHYQNDSSKRAQCEETQGREPAIDVRVVSQFEISRQRYPIRSPGSMGNFDASRSTGKQVYHEPPSKRSLR